MDEYKAFLVEVRKSTGLDALVPNDEGLVEVCVDERYPLSFQYVEGTGEIFCAVEVARLAADAPKEVYRLLLSAGLFGRDTAGGYFAIATDLQTVVYCCRFDFSAVSGDVEGFVNVLDNIVSLCVKWSERIGAIAA